MLERHRRKQIKESGRIVFQNKVLETFLNYFLLPTPPLWLISGHQCARSLPKENMRPSSHSYDIIKYKTQSNLVVRIHFVKLVNAADPVVGQHERSGLDDEVRALLVFDNSCGQASGSARLARSVDGSRAEVRNLDNSN